MGNVQAVAVLASSVGSFVLVILAWMFSNARLSRLETHLDAASAKHSADMAEIRSGLSQIDNHLMTFYTVTGKVEGRLEELSRSR